MFAEVLSVRSAFRLTIRIKTFFSKQNFKYVTKLAGFVATVLFEDYQTVSADW